MKLESFNCNSCGAPLQVAEQSKYVTCQHCHVRLAITRDKCAPFTEEAAQLKNQAAQLAMHQAIERLDREWEAEKKKYMWRDNWGGLHMPSANGSLATAIVAVPVAFVSLCVAPQLGAALAIFGFVALIATAIWAGDNFRKAKMYEVAEQRYWSRRESLLLEQFRHGDED